MDSSFACTSGTASQSRRLARLTALSMAAQSGLPMPSGPPSCPALEITSAMRLQGRCRKPARGQASCQAGNEG
jgi:hypothetical protein